MKRLLASLFIALLAFLMSSKSFVAKADDLIIQDDGRVVLVIAENQVLSASTEKTKEQEKVAPPPSKPAASLPAVAAPKTVPLVPSHTESTIKINPPINNDKKVRVTITPLQKASGQGSNAVSSSSPTPSSEPNNVMVQTVDQVVTQGAAGQSVFNIKSDQARQLTIQQGSTKVTTSLPLQIDSLTHVLSVPSERESIRVSVLPTEAVEEIVNKGFLDEKSLSQAKISLTQDSSGVDYSVESKKEGKLFGTFNVSSPVNVTFSAQNGKVIRTSRSVLFTVFGRFIK